MCPRLFSVRVVRSVRAELLEEVDHDDRVLQLQQNGMILGTLPPSARCDRELVLAAAVQNPMALQYAAPEIREDALFVYIAIMRHQLLPIQTALDDIQESPYSMSDLDAFFDILDDQGALQGPEVQAVKEGLQDFRLVPADLQYSERELIMAYCWYKVLVLEKRPPVPLLIDALHRLDHFLFDFNRLPPAVAKQMLALRLSLRATYLVCAEAIDRKDAARKVWQEVMRTDCGRISFTKMCKLIQSRAESTGDLRMELLFALVKHTMRSAIEAGTRKRQRENFRELAKKIPRTRAGMDQRRGRHNYNGLGYPPQSYEESKVHERAAFVPAAAPAYASHAYAAPASAAPAPVPAYAHPGYDSPAPAPAYAPPGYASSAYTPPGYAPSAYGASPAMRAPMLEANGGSRMMSFAEGLYGMLGRLSSAERDVVLCQMNECHRQHIDFEHMQRMQTPRWNYVTGSCPPGYVYFPEGRVYEYPSQHAPVPDNEAYPPGVDLDSMAAEVWQHASQVTDDEMENGVAARESPGPENPRKRRRTAERGQESRAPKRASQDLLDPHIPDNEDCIEKMGYAILLCNHMDVVEVDVDGACGFESLAHLAEDQRLGHFEGASFLQRGVRLVRECLDDPTVSKVFTPDYLEEMQGELKRKEQGVFSAYLLDGMILAYAMHFNKTIGVLACDIMCSHFCSIGHCPPLLLYSPGAYGDGTLSGKKCCDKRHFQQAEFAKLDGVLIRTSSGSRGNHLRPCLRWSLQDLFARPKLEVLSEHCNFDGEAWRVRRGGGEKGDQKRFSGLCKKVSIDISPNAALVAGVLLVPRMKIGLLNAVGFAPEAEGKKLNLGTFTENKELKAAFRHYRDVLRQMLEEAHGKEALDKTESRISEIVKTPTDSSEASKKSLVSIVREIIEKCRESFQEHTAVGGAPHELMPEDIEGDAALEPLPLESLQEVFGDLGLAPAEGKGREGVQDGPAALDADYQSSSCKSEKEPSGKSAAALALHMEEVQQQKDVPHDDTTEPAPMLHTLKSLSAGIGSMSSFLSMADCDEISSDG